MAITVTSLAKIGEKSNLFGLAIFSIAFSTGTAYATNGVTVDLSKITPPGVTFAELVDFPIWATNGYTADYVKGTTFANGKVKLYVGGVEVTNAVDLAAPTVLHGQLYFRTKCLT